MDTKNSYPRHTRHNRTKKLFKSTTKRSVVRKNKRRRIRKNAVVKGAESRLKGFKQASILAVALTGFILMIFSADETFSSEELSAVIQSDTIFTDSTTDTLTKVQGTEQAAGEAIGALQTMWNNFIFNYPKIIIALGILVVAWL
ncbi:MAG TPA: hypothetical protein VFD91_06140, partial [Mariniphaga sp.]|nr:hypothetical protein [Mariniphaga sp.]